MVRIRVGVIDRSTESQRFHCSLMRATRLHGLKMATVDTIPIRKLARTVTVPRKPVR
jgi:hypothetical protein